MYEFQVLQQVKYRVEWCKYQIRERKKEEEALERERSKKIYWNMCSSNREKN